MARGGRVRRGAAAGVVAALLLAGCGGSSAADEHGAAAVKLRRAFEATIAATSFRVREDLGMGSTAATEFMHPDRTRMTTGSCPDGVGTIIFIGASRFQSLGPRLWNQYPDAKGAGRLGLENLALGRDYPRDVVEKPDGTFRFRLDSVPGAKRDTVGSAVVRDGLVRRFVIRTPSKHGLRTMNVTDYGSVTPPITRPPPAQVTSGREAPFCPATPTSLPRP
jgi:hypothetical protein